MRAPLVVSLVAVLASPACSGRIAAPAAADAAAAAAADAAAATATDGAAAAATDAAAAAATDGAASAATDADAATPADAVFGDVAGDVPAGDGPAGAPTDYDLPFQGLALGAAVANGSPGNITNKNTSGDGGRMYMVFQLESLRPIVAFQYQNRIDHFPLGVTDGGYSDKTYVERGTYKGAARHGDTPDNVDYYRRPIGGDIRLRVREVTSPPGPGPLAVGPVLGQTDVVYRAGREESWRQQWIRSGGDPQAAIPTSFRDAPTWWLETPIDPVARGWQLGRRIAVELFNTAPWNGDEPIRADNATTSRWTSSNHAYQQDRPNNNRSAYANLKDWACYNGGGAYRREHFPMLLIGHRSGEDPLYVKGNPLFRWAGNNDRVPFAGIQKVRQLVVVPDDPAYVGKRIRTITASVFRTDAGSGNGTLKLELRRAGPTPGACGDDGTLLASRSVSASAYLAPGNISRDIPETYSFPEFDLPELPVVQPGDVLYVQFSITGTSHYVLPQMLNFLARAPVGLRRPDHMPSDTTYQRDDGAGWRTIADHAGDELTLGIMLLFDAGPP